MDTTPCGIPACRYRRLGGFPACLRAPQVIGCVLRDSLRNARWFAIVAASFLPLLSSYPAAASTVAVWDFQVVDTGTTGTSTPSIGTGTVTPLGGVTNAGFSSGDGSNDPVQPGFGFQTGNYPAQGEGSGTAGVRFNVSTTGFAPTNFNGLEIAFDLRTSNTSSRWYRLDYTLDGGSSWFEGSSARLGATNNAGDSWHNNNLASITDLNALDNPDFAFRVVSVFSPVGFTEALSSTVYLANEAYEVARNTGSGRIYEGGTWRFDMVTVTAVPEPSTAILLIAAIVGTGLTAAYRRTWLRF